MKKHETSSEKPISNASAFWLLTVFLILLTILQTFLASRYSLWGDEFDTIKPAFLPWQGERDFFWQIKQYNANPPGDNLVMRILYKTEFLSWMRDLSWEVFWRIPSLLVYSLTVFSAFWMGRRWSGSSLIGWLAVAAFIAVPGPFPFATEARFYSWVVLFMMLVVWQTLILIDRGFRSADLAILSLLTALGVCFHVALAIPAHLLYFGGIWILLKAGFDRWVKKRKFSWADWLRIAGAILLCIFPYLLFKYAKKNWMFLPGPGPKGLAYALVRHWHEGVTEITGRLSDNFQKPGFWDPYGFFLLAALLLSSLAFSVWKRRRAGVYSAAYLLLIYVGGVLAVFAGSKATDYILGGRNYLFEVPVIVISGVFLLFQCTRGVWNRIPDMVQTLGIVVLFVLTCAQTASYAHRYAWESSSKSNTPLADFVRFYSQLPDRRKLLVVGAGDGDLWIAPDRGGYLGGAHNQYLQALNPTYLTRRRATPWVAKTSKRDWAGFDLLVFEPIDDVLKKDFASIPWDQMKCFKYPVGVISFCRIP